MSKDSPLPTVLEGIVEGRKGHLDEIRQRVAHVDFDTLPKSERSLYANLKAPGTSFIMECKSSSPSLGLIREHYEPGAIASVYSRYAAGISVLCEPNRFGGDYDHLATVASTTHLPVLCKDFIIDEVQVYAARYYGADAILLMLSVLDDEEYTRMANLADSLGMDVLTEVIDEEEATRAAKLGAKIFGVNHRNLHDLSIDLTRSARLAKHAPADAVVVSESGIRNVETVRQLGAHSDGFLVGSQLTSQPDIDLAARELVYGPNKVCGLTSFSAAQAAKAAGAVYGGLIFEDASPRDVSRETSADIIAHEPGLKYVAVSRRTSDFAELIQPGIHAVQIHAPYQGSLEAELDLIGRVREEVGTDIEVWRAVSMSAGDGGAVAEGLHASVDKLVLDAHAGGSGETFDWANIPDTVKPKTLLAGGLNPENLAGALGVGCAGLDLNSGVEYPAGAGLWAGRKDAGALRRAFDIIGNYHYPRTNNE
ncbi:bifunctional indole-3-glycerol-phosphate synthase TrpC/phosphoribosylanthranilate isomerase TrpF [Corynebacterium sp. HMSC074A01]|uniref:bifunctional indole-3-glycerol-phosphate synthase TrpC/phosphoribosylanthranilate isomerase TrpF n=1 Tax=Corynebacterium sp. HMSC074A01 TaxID=1715030 RepID=UPI0008A1C7AE|nr:bifunctional indole-3-glycerol-phosphate synthase TrpC/phosphoribosylanthranilate isomerase TrpF [Corynebacterium sp. HMSC074A01]OHF40310.1 bifunctional indole-3-glycerol phosphate synthase/phosphoribosylanthranilate isomerase [Corynebacterium sp. HMSC074A01]